MKVIKCNQEDVFSHDENKKLEKIINDLNSIKQIYEVTVKGPDEIGFEFHAGKYHQCVIVEFKKENNPSLSEKDNLKNQEKYAIRENYEDRFFNGGGGYSLDTFPWCLDGIFLVWDSSKKNPKKGLFNDTYIHKAKKIETAVDIVNAIALFVQEEWDHEMKKFQEYKENILDLLKEKKE